MVTWEPLPSDYTLPDEPVENIQQPLLAAALTDALGEANWIQPQMLIASNFALVATVDRNTVVKAPDWLFAPQVNPVSAGVIRRSYTPNLEGGPVALVMEFLSETEAGEYSLRPLYPYGKLYFYESILQIPTYVIFDPATATLEVRTWQEGRYVLAQPDQQGRFWIAEMGLFLGSWYGERLGKTIHWLRWWDQAGHLLLWSRERAGQEQARAEQEYQRAEQEQVRAEQAEQAAAAERQRAEQLAARLRDLGIDPETV
jgi:Uma2 family endonuclease